MHALKEILVIDDQPGDRAHINKELRAAGYNTVLAQNSAEALVALWEKQDIDVVLLDVRLPVINGLNIFEIIRKHFPDKKIIINSVLQNDGQRFLTYDADNYYEKSQDMSSLKEKIDIALNNRLKGKLGKNDQRISKRIPVRVLSTCEKSSQDITPAYVYFHSCTKDLSPTGGRFVVDEDIKVGQQFRIALELPGDLMPFLIDCEVVWVKKLEGSDSVSTGNSEIGVRFVKLDSPNDEQRLKKYLS